MSKAALNMATRNLSIELGRSRPKVSAGLVLFNFPLKCGIISTFQLRWLREGQNASKSRERIFSLTTRVFQMRTVKTNTQPRYNWSQQYNRNMLSTAKRLT